MSPLHYAVQRGEEGIVRVLLQNGADTNLQNSSDNSALHMACTNLSHTLVELLMDSGADPNLQNMSVRGKDDMASLHYAVQRSQEDTMRVLLRLGADPNIQNEIGLSASHLSTNWLCSRRTTPFPTRVGMQGNRAEAEPLDKRSQDIPVRTKVLDPEHPDATKSPNNQAALVEEQVRVTELVDVYGNAEVEILQAGVFGSTFSFLSLLFLLLSR